MSVSKEHATRKKYREQKRVAENLTYDYCKVKNSIDEPNSGMDIIENQVGN